MSHDIKVKITEIPENGKTVNLGQLLEQIEDKYPGTVQDVVTKLLNTMFEDNTTAIYAYIDQCVRRQILTTESARVVRGWIFDEAMGEELKDNDA